MWGLSLEGLECRARCVWVDEEQRSSSAGGGAIAAASASMVDETPSTVLVFGRGDIPADAGEQTMVVGNRQSARPIR